MKISICIPQYNRINYLLRSLSIIEQQTYEEIEIVISDDFSSDDTEEKIKSLVRFAENGEIPMKILVMK